MPKRLGSLDMVGRTITESRPGPDGIGEITRTELREDTLCIEWFENSVGPRTTLFNADCWEFSISDGILTLNRTCSDHGDHDLPRKDANRYIIK